MAKGPDKFGRGRPTVFQPAYVEHARKLCLLGFTDEELADFFDVNEATINRWKVDHPDFLRALKDGKHLADSQVAAKMYEKATGAVVKRTERRDADGGVTVTIEEIPPDTTAGIFWLHNRQRGKWSREQPKVQADAAGPDIEITIVKPDAGTT